MNVAETNGHAQRQERHPSLFADLAGVVEDHIHLATLEAQYEIQQTRRRAFFLAVAGILALAAFLLGQVAIVYGLVDLFKWPVWAVCLLLMVVYGVVAAFIVVNYTARDLKAGAPFSGTRRELIDTLQWIQKLF